jgi:hypothetical protein
MLSGPKIQTISVWIFGPDNIVWIPWPDREMGRGDVCGRRGRLCFFLGSQWQVN